jgi:hypothetical protein
MPSLFRGILGYASSKLFLSCPAGTDKDPPNKTLAELPRRYIVDQLRAKLDENHLVVELEHQRWLGQRTRHDDRQLD